MQGPILFHTRVSCADENGAAPAAAEFSIDRETACMICELQAVVMSVQNLVAGRQLVNVGGLCEMRVCDRRARYWSPSNGQDADVMSAEADHLLFVDPDEGKYKLPDYVEVDTKGDVLVVSDTEFWFEACLRHMPIEVRSRAVPIKDLGLHFPGLVDEALRELQRWQAAHPAAEVHTGNEHGSRRR